MKLILISLFGIALNCNSGSTGENRKEEMSETRQGTKPSFEKVAQGDHSNMEEPALLIIGDEKELQAVYTKINMIRKPGLPVPVVDFSANCIVAHFMGQKNVGGFSTVPFSIDEFSENVNITFEIHEPDTGDIVTQVITTPFCIVKVNRPADQVSASTID